MVINLLSCNFKRDKTGIMRKAFLLFACIALAHQASAQMTTRVVRDSLFIPWEMVYGQDNHIWFTQKNGYICRMEPTSGHIDTLYHETNTVIQSEGGMLGLALDPNFSANPYVYVAYNYNQGGYKERIVRYTYGSGSLSNPTILLDNIDGANYHNGCRLEIINNQLYLTTGDATNTSTSQNTSLINGKTLRINLDGSIPTDNPINGSAIWSWGHRNPQGLVYANNKLYSSEHGPNNDDEVNIITKGGNYGWPNVQGFCNTTAEMTFCNDSNVIEPLYAWTPTIAVSGIDYYNHPMFPSLQGSLIMATLKDQKLYQLKLNNSFDAITNVSTISAVNVGRIRAVCISPNGSIFISTSNSTASGTGSFTDKIVEVYDPSFSNVPTITKKNITIEVYPNPSKDMLTLKPSQDIAFGYKILNAVGSSVGSGTTTINDQRINVSKLSGGIYILQVFNAGEPVLNFRFIKQ